MAYIEQVGRQIANATAAAESDSSTSNSEPRVIIGFDQSIAGDDRAMRRELQRFINTGDIANSAEFNSSAVDLAEIDAAGCVIFNKLGVAVCRGDSDRLNGFASAASSDSSYVIFAEPECALYEADGVSETRSDDYLNGYRDAVDDLSRRMLTRTSTKLESPQPAERDVDERVAQQTAAAGGTITWGLHATGVHNSPYSGRGVKIAVLDSGFESTHPDFQNRNITRASFISSQAVSDGTGHGTHVIGTACGPQTSVGGARYGIAYDAAIYSGRVLENNGRTMEPTIWAGLEWAINQGCQLINISIASLSPATSARYELLGQRALNNGLLVIAAAGNNARRNAMPPNYGYVAAPANAKSVMAVGALDSSGKIFVQSGRSQNFSGAYVDIAAPGVNVVSSSRNGGFVSMEGTSMAAPHVTGIAALWCEKTGKIGSDLFVTLLQNAAASSLSSLDVGKGLIQAPT